MKRRAAIVSGMLLALSAAASDVVYRPGTDWRPLTFSQEVVKDSALDFSFLNDAPAGKYGKIKLVGDHFEFADRPGEKVRLYGTNLCAKANFLSHAEADALAERLARIGYNTVRLHHYDVYLVEKEGKDSLTVIPHRQDQLDYLVSALEKRGMYITYDLYSRRLLRPAETPGLHLTRMNEIKWAAVFSPAVNANLKAFAKLVLTHRNPYTGHTMADDPAVLGICVVNESLLFTLDFLTKENGLLDLVNRQFDAHCAKRRIKITPQNRTLEFNRFVYDRYMAYWRDMRRYLKDELKVALPLTEFNHRKWQLTFGFRQHYDYVDEHSYWAHRVPKNPPKVYPYETEWQSSVASGMQFIRELGPNRIFGKPFTVTEFNFCFPNPHRSEGGPLIGAYAAFQDWDALYRFDHAGGYDSLRENRMGCFDLCSDPIGLLSERIGLAFFSRGDVKPARSRAVIEVKPRDVDPKGVLTYPESAGYWTLLRRVGSRAGKAMRVPKVNQRAGKYVGDTGELAVDIPSGTFKAAGTRSEALVLPEGKTLTGRRLTARAVRGFATCALIDLPQPGRYLALHLTDAAPEGLPLSGNDRKLVTAEPKSARVLGRKGVAEFALTLPEGKYQIYALDVTGKRLTAVPARYEKGRLRFTADTFAVPDEVVFAYEIVSEGQ